MSVSAGQRREGESSAIPPARSRPVRRPPRSVPAAVESAPLTRCPRCEAPVRACRYADARPVLVDSDPVPWGRLIVSPSGLVLGSLAPSSTRRTGDAVGFVDHATVCPGPARSHPRPDAVSTPGPAWPGYHP